VFATERLRRGRVDAKFNRRKPMTSARLVTFSDSWTVPWSLTGVENESVVVNLHDESPRKN